MHKFLNIRRLFSEELRYDTMTEEMEQLIQNTNKKLLIEIQQLIQKHKDEKALTLFIEKGRDLPRGEQLYSILNKINPNKIKSQEKKLILEAQKITNRYAAEDYEFVIQNTEKIFTEFSSLLKFKYHDMSARLINFYIESYKKLLQTEVARIKIDEYLAKDISVFAKGSLLIAKYEIEKKPELLERAHDMYLQGGFLSDAISILSLYANQISLTNQNKMIKVEEQLEKLFLKSNDVTDIYLISIHYFGLIIKYKDMKEYQTALNYAKKIIVYIMPYAYNPYLKDVFYRTMGVLGELCHYLQITEVALDNASVKSIKICNNHEDVPSTAKKMDSLIIDKDGHWEIMDEICINRNFENFTNLEAKFKDNKQALAMLYLRYAEHNSDLSYIEKVGYLSKSLSLVKDDLYFDQQKAHIYKTFAGVFLNENDFDRYFEYAGKYIDIIPYDKEFNAIYIKILINNEKWELLEKFIYLNNVRVEETSENKYFLAKALYHQNKELDKALTLLVEVDNKVSDIYKVDLDHIKKDLLNRKCIVNFDLTKTKIKECVTIQIFKDALNEYIKYTESNLRKDYVKFDKKISSYKWVSNPEEKCKKDLKFFLDTKFGEEIEAIDEVSIGAGYIDLYLVFKSGLEIIIELKICGNGYSAPYAGKGINQLKHYLHNKQSKIGYLIIYDARKRDFGKSITSNIQIENYMIDTKFIDMRMDTQT